MLSLAAEAADAQPVLCLIDDAQWIDQTSLQALAFAARRLYGESVAMIFATRTGIQVPDLAGLPELVLGGLPDPDARAVLATVVPGRLDVRVRDRIVAEAAGKPLALLEFSREVTAAGDLAGGFGVSPWRPSSSRSRAPCARPTRARRPGSAAPWAASAAPSPARRSPPCSRAG